MTFTTFAASCSGGNLFGFPTWYHYLSSTTDSSGNCTPVISGLSDIWLIVAAVIEILLRVAALAAVIFIIWGGVQYTTSQGSPDQTSRARSTITNALVGLLLAISAAAIISFIAGSIH